jgi:hypothetical protein
LLVRRHRLRDAHGTAGLHRACSGRPRLGRPPRPPAHAPCMPGASFESVEGDAFTGNVKIKLVRSTCSIAARLAASPTPPTYVIGTGGPPVSPWPCTRGSHRRPNSIARGGEQDPARAGRGRCGCCRRGGHALPSCTLSGHRPPVRAKARSSITRAAGEPVVRRRRRAARDSGHRGGCRRCRLT